MRKKTEKVTTNFAESDKLSIHLLGSAEVNLGANALNRFGSRKAQALLYYLAMAQSPCARDTLAGLLWPEMAEQKAKSNLRVAIASLKKQIGPHLDASPASIALNRQLPYELDVDAFQNQLATARLNQDLAGIGAAVARYRGEFLQGFHVLNAATFEEWVLQQREYLRGLAIQGLEAFITFSLEQRAYAAGLTAGRQLLMIEPWHEDAHRKIMTLLALSRQRAAALNQFEVCRRQLQTELGVAPAPETIALYEKIKTGAFEQASETTLPQPASADHSLAEIAGPVRLTSDHATIPNNLTIPPTDFTGRAAELSFIRNYLTVGESRLLTILGPGGMGKSRLAIEAALGMLRTNQAEFPHGIYVVSFSGIDKVPVKDEAETAIVAAVAKAVGCQLQVNLPLHTQLYTHLYRHRLLLVLDNLESLIVGAESVHALLAHTRHVRVLVTSRVRLRISGEQTLVLEKLSLPANSAHLQQTPSERTIVSDALVPMDNMPPWQSSEAVALFVQRAQAINRHFALTAETYGPICRICSLVDGLPLGIELAASWLHILSCNEIAQEIEQSLDFLVSDVRDSRQAQHTLRVVFDRSWRMLTSVEQALMTQLAIFPATFQRDATQAVTKAPASLLANLVNHSLLNVTSTGVYAMHRCTRAFATEKLMQQPKLYEELQRRYVRFYLHFMAERENTIKGAAYAVGAKQITAELTNIRTAWDWATTHLMIGELQQCLEALSIYYEQRGLFGEGVERMGHTITQIEQGWQIGIEPPKPVEQLLIGRLHSTIGWYNARLGKRPEAERSFRTGFERIRQSGKQSEEASTQSLFHWGVTLSAYLPKRASAMLEESIMQLTRAGDKWRLPIAWSVLGVTHLLRGSYGRADLCSREAERLAYARSGPYSLDLALQTLGRVELARGHYDVAAGFFRTSHEFAQQGELKPLLTMSQLWLGETCRLQGQSRQAQTHYEKCRKLAEEINLNLALSGSLWGLGCLAEGEGDFKMAKTFLMQSQALAAQGQWIHMQPTLGWALLGMGEVAQAKRYFQDIAERAQVDGLIPTWLDAKIGLAYIEYRQGLHEALDNDLQFVYRHSAATQETRERILTIAAKTEATIHGTSRNILSPAAVK